MATTYHNNKKRIKTESINDDTPTAVVGKTSYEEELEARLLQIEAEVSETKSELLETKKKLQEFEAKAGSTENDDMSDGEESAALDSSDPWMAKYLELREYRIVNGHCKVPQRGDNPKLGV
jgi:hypothetical protein